jgi:hypothetical protein
MRNKIVLSCLLIMSLTAVQQMAAQESGEMNRSPETAKVAEPPAHFYHLEIVLEQVDADGKPTNSRSYSAVVSTARNDNNAQIRTGARVPIAMGQYQDIGVNIDARSPRDVAGKLTLYMAADISSIADSKESNGMNDHPIFETNKWQGQVLIPIGKATTVFSSDDIRSKGSMRMVVTATLLQ